MAGWGTNTPDSGAELNAIREEMRQLLPTMGYTNPRVQELRNREMAIIGQAMSGQGSAKAAGDDQLAKSRQKVIDLTEGRGDAIMNDAQINAALARLNDVSSGKDAPFTDQVVNQMNSAQAGSRAAAMGQQADSLRNQFASLGMSPTDPAFQAKMRELNQNRQSANVTGLGNLQSQAQLENFGARQTGTNALLSGRMGQQALANNPYSQAAQFYQNDSASDGHVSGVPQYNFMYSGGNQNAATLPAYNVPAIQPYGPTGAATQGNAAVYTPQTTVSANSGGNRLATGNNAGSNGYVGPANTYRPPQQQQAQQPAANASLIDQMNGTLSKYRFF